MPTFRTIVMGPHVFLNGFKMLVLCDTYLHLTAEN